MAAMRSIGLTPVLPPDARVDELQDECVVRLRVPGFALEEFEIEPTGRVVMVCGDQTRTAGDDAIASCVDRVPGVVAVTSRLRWEDGR